MLSSRAVGRAGSGRGFSKGRVSSASQGLMPHRPNPNLLSLQNKNYKAVCLELKPEPIKVRSDFEATMVSRPETRGEVTWSQGSFAMAGGQDLSQVLGVL